MLDSKYKQLSSTVYGEPNTTVHCAYNNLNSVKIYIYIIYVCMYVYMYMYIIYIFTVGAAAMVDCLSAKGTLEVKLSKNIWNYQKK